MIANGIDRIQDYAHLLQGKRLGLITSPTGLNRKFESTIQILHERFQLTALFSPEHGVRGIRQQGRRLKPTGTRLPACRCTVCTARTPSG